MEQVVIYILGLLGVIVLTRYQTGENKKHIEDAISKIETQSAAITALQTKQELQITAKEVSEHYLSKEHFRQFEKHIDDKFSMVLDGQGKILSTLERLSSCAVQKEN